MAFEYSTIDDIRKLAEEIRTQTREFAELRTRLWPAMKDDVTEERILLTELTNRVDRLSKGFADLLGILSRHLADGATLDELDR